MRKMNLKKTIKGYYNYYRIRNSVNGCNKAIKKRILQKLTTGVTATTEGTFIQIIPDLTATYSMKFNVNNKVKDVGIFELWEEDSESGQIDRPVAPDPPEDELVIGLSTILQLYFNLLVGSANAISNLIRNLIGHISSVEKCE